MSSIKTSVLWAIAAVVMSGMIAAATLKPVIQVAEASGIDGIVMFLSAFGLTAGLAFGLLGAAFARWQLKVSPRAGAVFILMSVLGMAAAVYVAALSIHDNTESLLRPYVVGSPVGAALLAAPFAILGRFAHPWRTTGLAIALPTLWAAGLGAVVHVDAALEMPGLAALYIGWQGIFLIVFAASARKV